MHHTSSRPRLRPARPLVCFLALATLLVSLPPAFSQGLGEENRNQEKWNQRRKKRLDEYRDESGKLRADLYRKGIKKLKELPIAAGVPVKNATGAKGPNAVNAAPGLTGVQWVQIGPQPAVPLTNFNFQGNGPMSGEVVDIAIDPRGNSDQVIYIATNQGGIWRSTDGGVTFQPRTDYFPTLSMGAVALDKGNPSIVYAGTGNLFDGNGNRWQTDPRSISSPNAVGIYKSTDMGQTWSIINPGGIFDANGFNRMVSPSPGVLLAGTNTGLFRSVNYGENFGNNSPLFDNGLPIRTGDITDLDIAVDFGTSNTIYVSVRGVGVLTYTEGDTTLPNSENILTAANGGPGNAIQFLRFAQAESDAMRMYATVEGFAANDHQVADTAPPQGADRFEGFYRSNDGGLNWTRLDGSGSAEGAAERNGNRGCQCGYDQTIAVDPQDEDIVYIGFQAVFKSTDGGVTFSAVSDDKIHWDQHAHYFSPPAHRSGGAPTKMWLGSDGGIHSSTDGGATFSNDHNITIATNLFTDMDMGYGSAANNAFTYGGTQDTGTLQTHPGVPNVPTNERWSMGINGDGGGIGVDTGDANRAYLGGNNGYQVTTDGGASWNQPGGYVGPAFAWRYAIDFNNPSNVFMVQSQNAGFDPDNVLLRSADQGVTYTPIFSATPNIQAIGNTPTDSNVIWLGLDNGQVVRSTDALAVVPTFTTMTIPGNPGNRVGNIAISPLNTDVVAVTFGGLCGNLCNNDDNRQKRIFMTTNGGTTWNDISGTDGNPSGNLPNLPIHSVVFDSGTSPATLVVSMDGGVLRSSNNGATWQQLGVGLPTVDGTRLRIDNTATPTLLRLATYGRSMWELQQAQGPILAVNADLGFGTLCVGEKESRIVQVFNVGSEDLIINAFFRSEGSADFRVIGGPSTPVVIAPGGQINFTVEFAPSTPGPQTAKFQINSNDQFFPQFTIDASGTGNVQMITTVISGAGNFGDVCEDTFKDLTLTIANVGCGSLSVSNIVSSSSQFEVAQVMSYPLTISAGNSIEIPIRFEPNAALACGDTRNATLTISNNDPAVPSKVVNVQATVPCGDLNVAIANSGDFGNVCSGAQKDLNLTLFNQGKCNVNISDITSSNGNFVLPGDLQLPLVLSHDADFNLPIRFSPDPEEVCDDDTPREGIITIVSDSPGESPLEIEVSGTVPCPNLVIDPVSLTQIYSFPATVVDTGEALGCFTERPFVVRNTGACPLSIESMNTGGSDDFAVVAPTQFPIILPPGEETLTGKIRFTPQAGGDPRVADGETLGTLTIVSDDPDAAGTAPLCGEGVVQSGIRFLVTNVSTGTPVAIDGVDDIRVTSKGKNTPSPYSVRFTNQAVQGPVAMCGNNVSYHVDLEELSSAATTGNNPMASYEVSVKEGNLQTTETFSIGQCDFVERQYQLTSQSGGGKGGGKPPKP